VGLGGVRTSDDGWSTFRGQSAVNHRGGEYSASKQMGGRGSVLPLKGVPLALGRRQGGRVEAHRVQQGQAEPSNEESGRQDERLNAVTGGAAHAEKLAGKPADREGEARPGPEKEARPGVRATD
jgi:hypothetical protein